MSGPNQLRVAELRIASTIAETKRLHRWLDEVLREEAVPEAPGHAIRLCLEEAVMNIALHGYGEDTPGPIELRLWRGPPGLLACVADRAPGFDPSAAPVLAPAGGQAGGRGLKLIRGFARLLRYERADGQNRLTMGFAI